MTTTKGGDKSVARKKTSSKTRRPGEKERDVAEVLLPFAVPPLVHGFESYIASEARKLSRSDDPVAYERAARAVMFAVYRKLLEYRVRGELATDKKSLAAQLAG